LEKLLEVCSSTILRVECDITVLIFIHNKNEDNENI
jgi:hypothetical protein